MKILENLFILVILFLIGFIPATLAESLVRPIANKIDPPPGVPTNYSDCMKTEKKYGEFHNRTELKCVYAIVGELQVQNFNQDDKIKFDYCQKMGGIPVTYTASCALTFYNPDYIFPRNYEDCIKNNKGEPNASISKHCDVDITPAYAYNKAAADNLLNQCKSLGGIYNQIQALGTDTIEHCLFTSWEDPTYQNTYGPRKLK